MTVPWLLYPKSRRDKLYDLMLSFNKIIIDFGKCGQFPDLNDTTILVKKVLEIEVKLRSWKISWLKEACPQAVDKCNCLSPGQLSCICTVPDLDFPTVDFALLQLECWALQLLMSTTLDISLSHDDHRRTSWAAHLPKRTSKIANYIEGMQDYSKDSWVRTQSSAITENQCRAILANWALREHKQDYMRSDNTDTPQQSPVVLLV